MSILIVEDEKNLGVTLSEYLNGLGKKTYWAANAEMARELFKMESPAVVLMDIGLPDGNGLDLAREFRNVRKDFVLFFLSAQNDPDTRVEGLEIGAEDYITKPFALRELVLRLERVMGAQKAVATIAKELVFGQTKVYFSKFEIIDANGKTQSLSQKECFILKLLYQKKGNAVTRDEIIESVWGENSFPSNRTVDNYIVRLRKIFEIDQSQTIEIQSIRGIGYKLAIKE